MPNARLVTAQRAQRANRWSASIAQPTFAAEPAAGTTPSPRWWACKANMRLGWKPCRQNYETAPSLNRCRWCAISILPSFRRSNRRVVSVGIEQRDGPDWKDGATITRGRVCADTSVATEPRVDAGMKELNEMTIGRTDDPKNPPLATAFKAASLFGCGSRNPSGPAAMAPRR